MIAGICGGSHVWLWGHQMLIMTWSIKGGGWLTWDISDYKEACGYGSSGEVFILAHKTLFLHVHRNSHGKRAGAVRRPLLQGWHCY